MTLAGIAFWALCAAVIVWLRVRGSPARSAQAVIDWFPRTTLQGGGQRYAGARSAIVKTLEDGRSGLFGYYAVLGCATASGRAFVLTVRTNLGEVEHWEVKPARPEELDAWLAATNTGASTQPPVDPDPKAPSGPAPDVAPDLAPEAASGPVVEPGAAAPAHPEPGAQATTDPGVSGHGRA